MSTIEARGPRTEAGRALLLSLRQPYPIPPHSPEAVILAIEDEARAGVQERVEALTAALAEVLDNIDYINGADARGIHERARAALTEPKPVTTEARGPRTEAGRALLAMVEFLDDDEDGVSMLPRILDIEDEAQKSALLRDDYAKWMYEQGRDEARAGVPATCDVRGHHRHGLNPHLFHGPGHLPPALTETGS